MTMYTPAETIVAAWIIAETGVGPSIASGSQTCSGNCADLPIVPMNSRIPASPATESPKHTGIGVSPERVKHMLVEQDLAEAERAGGSVQQSDPQQHEDITDAGGHKGFDHRIPGGVLAIPETDQQVRAQAHDLPTDEQEQQVIGQHQGVHPESEQTDKGEEAGEHRLDRGDHMLVTVFAHSGAMRGQTVHVMVAFGLAPVVVADTVNEDHQDGDRDEEERDRRQRVNHHPDLEEHHRSAAASPAGSQRDARQMFSAHRLDRRPPYSQ